MMATRRLGRTHHEFRFGRRELVVLGAVFCLIASLVFAAGMVVGREMARGKGAARADATREHRLPEPEGLRGGEAPVKTAATRAEEKVTFYRTLTAPTQDLPQVGKPTIEERLVPKEEPKTSVAAPTADVAPEPARAVPEPPRAAPEVPRPAPEAPRAVPERRTSKAAEAVPAPRPARPARGPAAAPVRPAPTQVAAATTTAEPEAWTVQVSAFRSRPLAEELRARLAARGFDAYVFPSITEDGRPRYRVRVGTYPTRSDAERAAVELRSERGLNPLVTPRTR
jgi:DedD protein